MIASVASYINNIGGCIAVGAASGLISGLWLRIIHPKISNTYRYDQFGLAGTILINAIIGCFIVAPTVFGAYQNEGILPSTLTKVVTNKRSSTYYLAIFGTSLAISVATGIIAGLFCSILRNPNDDYNFTKIVSDDFGLYV